MHRICYVLAKCRAERKRHDLASASRGTRGHSWQLELNTQIARGFARQLTPVLWLTDSSTCGKVVAVLQLSTAGGT